MPALNMASSAHSSVTTVAHDVESPRTPVEESKSAGTVPEINLSQTEKCPLQTEAPPDGGYGWVCVMCCVLINSEFLPAPMKLYAG